MEPSMSWRSLLLFMIEPDVIKWRHDLFASLITSSRYDDQLTKSVCTNSGLCRLIAYFFYWRGCTEKVKITILSHTRSLLYCA